MGKISRKKRESRSPENKEIFSPKKSALERISFLIVEWGVYVALFAPLILFRTWFFPYVSPKTIFFRIIVDIIFIAYILLVISSRRYLPKINALTISITVFIGVLLLTSLTGINFSKSFWSVFERMTGLLTIFHLYVFFIILTSVFRERKYWERILTVSIIVGALASFSALFSNDPSSRGGATLGNPSFLAAYLLFDIFFAIILAFAKSGWQRFCYIGLLSIMLWVLFFNPQEATRGAIGAFLGGVVILGIGYMVFSQNKLLKRLVPFVAIFIILAGLGISQTSFFKKNLMDIRDLPGPSRLVVWQIGIDGWRERPWLGWGLENFNIPFTKYFNPQLPLTNDIWYDRVHNIVLDMMVQSGIVGLMSYLALFGVAILGLLKICPKVVEKRNLFVPLGMIAVLLTYFAQNIWVFDMISSYMMFFLSLAFINFLISDKEEGPILPQKNQFIPILGGFLIIFAIISFYFGNIQPARASKFIVKGLSSPLEQGIANFQKAIALSPISITEATEQFSKKIDDFGFDQSQDKKTVENGFLLSAEALKKSIEENPQDYRLYLTLGRHYNNFFFFSYDQERLKEAEFYLDKAMELSPRNQQTYWSLAQTKLSQQKPEEVISLLQKAVDLEPRYAQSSWYLALAYKILGKNELALGKVQDAEKAGFNWKGDSDSLKKVIEIYQNLKDDADLVNLYPLAIAMDPQNAQLYAAQAVALANLGQFNEARVSAQKAKELNPGLAQDIDAFLNSLPAIASSSVSSTSGGLDGR
jgi:O-antigen ligase/Flp pilus assembly protein TadD